MCLILFSYKTHPIYKLVVAANRDEFYERPTLAADFWEDHQSILGGRDVQAGGTWFGVNRSGALSMLTNYRDLANIKPNAPSRGKLVSDFLIGQPHPHSYLEALDNISNRFNGYNLVLGSPDDLWYYSNVQRKIYMLGSGIYGLSNALLDAPWPKLKKGKARLEQILAREDIIDPEVLFSTLYDDARAPDNELPDTGVGLEKERMLSSMFIKSPDYGTRCSTILLVDQKNNLTFSERIFNTTTFAHETRTFNFNISEEKVK